MATPDLTLSHARDLVSSLIQDDDGKHVPELLELLNGVCDPGSTIAAQLRKDLWVSTEQGTARFEEEMKTWAA